MSAEATPAPPPARASSLVSPGVQIVFDSPDPRALAAFWQHALGYVDQPPPEGFADWEAFLTHIGVPADRRDAAWALVDPDGTRPRLFFQKVPEGKTAKNRVHVDLNVGAGLPAAERHGAIRARASELVALGATQVRVVDEPTGWCVVMQDPDGNEFCLQ